jgi:hypothetical protein
MRTLGREDGRAPGYMGCPNGRVDEQGRGYSDAHLSMTELSAGSQAKEMAGGSSDSMSILWGGFSGGGARGH